MCIYNATSPGGSWARPKARGLLGGSGGLSKWVHYGDN